MRTGAIALSDADTVRRRFRADVRNRKFQVVRHFSRHYEQAAELLERYGSKHGLRTLDSLQLAIALDLRRNGLIEEMIAADKVIIQLGAAEGLKVVDREAVPSR